jgi:Peptidase family S41
MRSTIYALLLFVVSLHAADNKLTQADRDGEVQWLQSLGLKVPAATWPLEDPYAMPFTRRSLIVPTAWYRQRQQQVRADLFREDIKLLRRIMETAYGGWEIARKRGWDWDAFFRDWDADLAARGEAEIPIADAFAQWRKYMAVQLDNHSGPLYANFAATGRAFSWSAVLAREPGGTCTELRNNKDAVFPINASDPAQQPKKRQNIDGKPITYIVANSSKGAITAVHCGDAWIPAQPAWFTESNAERFVNIKQLSQSEKDVPLFRSISPRIGYLRFPTFSKANVELIRKLEPELHAKSHNEELLIVDLRSNDGGDVHIDAVTNWAKLRQIGGPRRNGASCLYPALRWGYAQVSSQSLKPPISAAMRSSLQHSLDSVMQKDDPACPAKFIETPAHWVYTQHQYPSKPEGKTRLLMLTDNWCGSDCEAAVNMLAAVPGAVIAGVNTFGVAGFVQPGYFVLPQTRMPFRVALGTQDHYGDGRSFDGYGFDVDIVLAEKKDQSAEAILSLAERLMK